RADDEERSTCKSPCARRALPGSSKPCKVTQPTRSTSAAVNANSHQRDPTHVAPRDIDAFWIQRQVAQHYPDAHEASEKADSAFDILSAESDVRDCENSLMELFDYDKFELVQILTKNRDAVVWCTRLARADDEERSTCKSPCARRALPGSSKPCKVTQPTR
ncbi:hypothetical protein CKK21_26100, partial [Enterobacter cloacae]